jgi:hypothetical protein
MDAMNNIFIFIYSVNRNINLGHIEFIILK